MNNDQFRRLLSTNAPSKAQNGTATPVASKASAGGAATGTSLGSRQRSSIPMTPRNVRGAPEVDFARQLVERNSSFSSSQTSRSKSGFRASAAPKGTKLAQGYQDRARSRLEAEEKDDDDEDTGGKRRGGGDDRESRIKALEESMKLGQIDAPTFERLRDDITGGDIGATHLVKGLDRRLLERVRRGEDVMSGDTDNSSSQKGDAFGQGDGVDLDAELEAMEQRELVPITRTQVAKKGSMAPPPAPAPAAVAGIKRSRNDILQEMKAARQAAAEAKAVAQPSLDSSRFRKIVDGNRKTRVERDERGREVLIVVDEQGREKRKVRKVTAAAKGQAELLMPDKDAVPLGMDAPERSATAAERGQADEQSDEDIFEGVGDDYNPLGDEDEDDSDSDEETEDSEAQKSTSKPQNGAASSTISETNTANTPSSAAATSQPAAKPRNYFNDAPASTSTDIPSTTNNPFTDLTIKAAIQRAAQKTSQHDPAALGGGSDAADMDADAARRKKHAAMLASSDRDMEDMDMGFGASRFDDGEDEGEGRLRLSEWKGGAGNGDGEDGEGGGKKRGGGGRKRGPKKKKGDKNSAADVLGVIERRKQ